MEHTNLIKFFQSACNHALSNHQLKVHGSELTDRTHPRIVPTIKYANWK